MPTLRGALAALDEAGLPYCVRNAGRALDTLPPGGDLDVLMCGRHLRRAGAVLCESGFHRLPAPGHSGHRFYVALDDDGDWRKIDLVSVLRYGDERLPVAPFVARRQRSDGIWTASDADERGHQDRRAAGRREPRPAWRRLARLRPAGVRRRGPVLAVLGPDGAGKGSTLAAARTELPVGVTVVYLGNRRPAAVGRPASASAGGVSNLPPSAVREAVFLLRKALPLWAGLAAAYAAAWRGHVVLCDRHPVEVLAIRPPRTPSGAALERLLMVRLPPAPDRVVVLDAPGDVLFARKGEHDPQTLERWRQGYLSTFVPPGTVVPTTGSLEDSVQHLLAVVWDELVRRQRWASPSRAPAQ